MRFPLDQKIIGGYRFRVRTWYKTLHLGTDWRAKYVKLYAPTKGKVLKAPWGTQGGQWLYFEDNQGNIHRFGHLSRVYVKSGKVKEGTLIAKTGNSGQYTSSPHLHEDITKAGFKVNWNKISQFLDPEKFYQLKKPMQEEPNENEVKLLKFMKKLFKWGDYLNSKERKNTEKDIVGCKKEVKELKEQIEELKKNSNERLIQKADKCDSEIVILSNKLKDRNNECTELANKSAEVTSDLQTITQERNELLEETEKLQSLQDSEYKALGLISRLQEALKLIMAFKK